MDSLPHRKIAHRPGIDEPRGVVSSGIVALPAPAGNRHAGYLPERSFAAYAAPSARLRPRKPHGLRDRRHQRTRRQRRFRHRARRADRGHVLRLRNPPRRTDRPQPQRLLGRLPAGAHPRQGRQGAHRPAGRSSAAHSGPLPPTDRAAKHLQFSGKSTNFNTERSAHFTERRAAHRGTGVEQGGHTGKKEPPRTAAHLCDASAEPRRGHARNTGAVGTLLQATQVYTHNSITRLQEIYVKAHPRERRKEEIETPCDAATEDTQAR